MSAESNFGSFVQVCVIFMSAGMVWARSFMYLSYFARSCSNVSYFSLTFLSFFTAFMAASLSLSCLKVFNFFLPSS